MPMSSRRTKRADVQSYAARRISWLILVLIAVCACDTRRSDAEPISECMEYARAAQPCFGERAADRLRASFAIPPRDEAERAALRKRCVVQRDRVRRVCR